MADVPLKILDADGAAIYEAMTGEGTALDPHLRKMDMATALDSTNDSIRVQSGKTVLRAAVSASASGNNTLVTADATKKIKVLSLFLMAAADVNVKLQTAAGGTDLTGLLPLKANQGFFLAAPADIDLHHFETAINQLLNLNLSGAVAVTGWIVYHLEA